MIVIAPPMIVTALLLIVSAFALDGHPILTTLDLFLAAYLLWNSITRHDPPSDGALAEIRG